VAFVEELGVFGGSLFVGGVRIVDCSTVKGVKGSGIGGAYLFESVRGVAGWAVKLPEGTLTLAEAL
jgi:hypothetical protein